ncbi:GST C-terminal domain-containing protein [Plasmodiophora brassicae]
MVATLYYAPVSCSACNFIVAHKAGLIGSKIDVYEVDIATHTVLTGPNKGADFYQINPKGNVPCLVLDDATILNENAATLQWIADQALESELGRAAGTNERYLVQSKVSYIASEVHAMLVPFFTPGTPDQVQQWAKAKLVSKLDYLSKHELGNNKTYYLVGNTFSIADSYLYISLSLLKFIGIDIVAYPTLKTYFDHIAALEFVNSAHAAMSAQ